MWSKHCTGSLLIFFPGHHVVVPYNTGTFYSHRSNSFRRQFSLFLSWDIRVWSVFECDEVCVVPFLLLLEARLLLSSIRMHTASHMPSSVSTQKGNLFLEKSIKNEACFIWKIVSIIFTIGLLCVKHFIFTSNPQMWTSFVSLFCWWGYDILEKLSLLPKLTEQERIKLVLEYRACVHSSICTCKSATYSLTPHIGFFV